MRDIEKVIKLLNNLTNQERNSDSFSLFNFFINAASLVVILSIALGAGVSFYITKNHFEHKIDPEVLSYIKNPSTALETEQYITQLINKKKQVRSELSLIYANLKKSEARISEIEIHYTNLKSKITDEKIIHSEAFQEKVEEIEAKYKEDLENAKNNAYNRGVSTGVIGTIGIQTFLDAD